MFILSLYFNEVVPRKHGEPRSLLFPLYWLIGLVSKKNRKKFGEEMPLLDEEIKDTDTGVAVRTEEGRRSKRVARRKKQQYRKEKKEKEVSKLSREKKKKSKVID